MANIQSTLSAQQLRELRRELDHNKIARAKMRFYLGLEINTDFVPDMSIRVHRGRPTLFYGSLILHQALDIYATETLIDDYRRYSGATLTEGQYAALWQPYAADDKPAADKTPPAYYDVPTRPVFDTLRAKGIDYYLTD